MRRKKKAYMYNSYLAIRESKIQPLQCENERKLSTKLCNTDF